MLPVRARLSGVTRKVSSYSIHTLLCSDEHKNPPEGRLRESRFQPQHKAERFAMSLECEETRGLFRSKKRQTLLFRHYKLLSPAEAIQPIFSYCRNQCTTIIHPPLGGERYMADKEVIARLKVSRRTLQEYRTERKIPYIVFGGKVLYRESDIEKMLAENYRKAIL